MPLVFSETRQHELGQFLTPNPVADFMASLFQCPSRHIELLDAGAGTGTLTSAFVRRMCNESTKPESISVTAFELDDSLIKRLLTTMAECEEPCQRCRISFKFTVINEDFISSTVPLLRREFFTRQLPAFNAAIVNPPYRKIKSDSIVRTLLRSADIETTNLYSAFLALIIRLLSKDGELVAITPRSYCNGPYFKPFRFDFLNKMSMRRLHIFESRSAAFSENNVLQENIIIHAIKDTLQSKSVFISSSSGEPGAPVTKHKVGFQDIVSPDDPERFIHLVLSETHFTAKATISQLSTTIDDLGLSVSTGRVVDFRAQAFLRQHPTTNTAPLIYSCHFNGGFVHWPRQNSRKPNAIVKNEQTNDLLLPSGTYVLVKRFTAKEERRRVVACIYDPRRIHAQEVGFENHLNYFHINGHGIPMLLAKGLSAFLNSTLLDIYFRQFSGHTQVNATDLRSLHYPTKRSLERLGSRVMNPEMSQNELDALVKEGIF